MWRVSHSCYLQCALMFFNHRALGPILDRWCHTDACNLYAERERQHLASEMAAQQEDQDSAAPRVSVPLKDFPEGLLEPGTKLQLGPGVSATILKTEIEQPGSRRAPADSTGALELSPEAYSVSPETSPQSPANTEVSAGDAEGLHGATQEAEAGQLLQPLQATSEDASAARDSAAAAESLQPTQAQSEQLAERLSEASEAMQEVQQPDASEQALEAAEQAIEAAEQLLEASEQPLAASEQQAEEDGEMQVGISAWHIG